MNDTRKTKAQLLDELTELRQQVAALEEHNLASDEERYRLLAANVTDMISRHSMEGDYLDVTASCRSLIGYEPEELISRNAYEFIHADDSEAVRESHDTIVDEERTYTVEFRVRHKEGHYVWAEAASHVVRTKTDAPYILVVTRDITERKLAEEKLAMFQYSIDQATDAIFWITYDAGFSYVNEQACRSLGYSREELLELNLWDIDPVFPKERWEATWREWRENRRGGGDNLETLHRRKDGSVFPVEVSVTHLWLGDHELHVAVCRDITERKQMEQDLLLNQVGIDQASVGIVRTGHEAQILSVNPYYCQLHGYTAEELCTMHTYDIDPDFPLERWREHRAHIRQHGSDTFETVHRRKDGTLFPVEVTATYVSYQDSGFSFSFVHDITERKQAEEALRLNNFALERTADAVYWINIAEIIDVNEAACRTLGYSREEFRGMSVTNIDPMVSKADIINIWKHIKKEGATTFESQHQTKDGRIVPVEVTANYIAFEGQELNCCFVRDITQRKRAEAALQASEERLQQAVRVGNIGIFDHDHIQEIIYLSPEYRNMLGWKSDEPVTFENFFKQGHPDDMEKVLQTIRRAHDPSSDGSYHMERRIIDRNGAVRWLSTHSRTFFEGEGSDRHPVRTIGATADITGRKQAEQQRLDLALEKERSDTLRMLIGNISHDIKTPLAIINTSLYLLEKHTNPQKRQEKIDNIRGQVHTMENFIQDLLALSRLDSNSVLRLTPVDVNQLVLDIEAETRPLIEQKRLAFMLDLAEDMTLIQADQADLRRALTNLVENALHYTPAGHTVTVCTRKQADKILVEVTDTGMGISENDLPHIFDRFYRSSQAQSISSSGSGLGLAIVQRVVEMHSGSIEVTSQPGIGSTFCIQLPLT